MATQSDDLAVILDTLSALRQEVARLGDRVAALECRSARPLAAAADQPVAANKSPAESLDDELVMVLSAAIAAYLGVKPRIRQIRLVGSRSWAQFGRATIQASHALPVPHK